MKTISCESIFSTCNRSFSSRLGSHHPRRLRHHEGGEMSTRMKPSQRPITELRTAAPHHHCLQRLLPLPKMRPLRVLHGVSISTICAKGIANITQFAHLLALIVITQREISQLRRNKLMPDNMRSSHYGIQAAIGEDRRPHITGGIASVGGSLLACCCWSGAAVDSIGCTHILLPQKKTFTLHCRKLKPESLFDRCPILVQPRRHTSFHAAHSICLLCWESLPLSSCFRHHLRTSLTAGYVMKIPDQSQGNRRSTDESARHVNLMT